MELEDFQTWRAVPPDRSRMLLDWDTRKPTEKTLESEDGPLARVAAVINARAKGLEAEDCEQIIRWMKLIKRERSTTGTQPDRDFGAFLDVLKELRDNPEQWQLMKGAALHRAAGSTWRIIAVAIFCVAVALALMAGVRWYWSGVTLAAAIAVYVRAVRRDLAAEKTMKEQEVRHLMQSIRAARSVQELSHAGLFAYLPGTDVGPGYDENAAIAAIRKERNRLTDALYHDPDWTLRE